MVEIDPLSELTEDEAELYDRQIRLWGLDSQKRLVHSINTCSLYSYRVNGWAESHDLNLSSCNQTLQLCFIC
jgi:hypothetical protein